VICLLALALALVFQWAPHVNLGLAALVLLAATLVLTVGPKQAGFLARSVSRVELMGASVEFGRAVENAEAAARQTAGDEPDSEGDPARATHDVVELRLALERKLAYVAKELLADPCGDHTHPTFVTVGSLGYDRLITDEQARTLSRLQTLSDQYLRHQDGAAVQAFLANAARVVGRLRATVFRNLVARELRDGGWVRRRGEGRLPTLASRWVREDESILVRPLFATGAAGRAAATRWRDELGGWPGPADRRIVVVPDRFRLLTTEPEPEHRPEAEVLKLADLRALAAPASTPRQRRTR
jgi:hypothetical protein